MVYMYKGQHRNENMRTYTEFDAELWRSMLKRINLSNNPFDYVGSHVAKRQRCNVSGRFIPAVA